MEQDRVRILRELHNSLGDQGPEAVVLRVLELLGVNFFASRIAEKYARAGRCGEFPFVKEEFYDPGDMARQLSAARALFGGRIDFAADNLEQIEAWIRQAERSINKPFGHNNFKRDRLTKEERKRACIGISRGQYNKRFRMATYLEKRARSLAREQFKRSLVLASKDRLAFRISWEDFSTDLNTACFIAYYTARRNFKDPLARASQAEPYDEVCKSLMQRCRQQEKKTHWWAIARLLPTAEVVECLDARQRGMLLGKHFNLLHATANFMQEVWLNNAFSDDMVRKRGDDWTTWNMAVEAWNKLRDGWVLLTYNMGMPEVVEQLYPGKAIRLITAEVAYWDRQSGDNFHRDTLVWNDVPRPWEVVSGSASCPKSLIERVCTKYGLDPARSLWLIRQPPGATDRVKRAGEFEHGIVVESPLLASIFRKQNLFSDG